MYLGVRLVSRARDARVLLVDLWEVLVDGDGEQGVPVPAHQAQLDLVTNVDLDEVSFTIKNCELVVSYKRCV